jgi:DNA-binding SARP family transcriptional activator
VLEYRILGPVEVVDETGPLSLGGQRQRAVLALLLLNVGSVVSTDRIVDEVWGEQPPKTVTTSLQNVVSQLRRLLGTETLVRRPPGYALQVERDQVDLGRFERLVAGARSQGAEERSRTLREALALWRGSPLADLAFETFALSEIRRLEELRLEALEARIDADLELGSGGELVGELERLVVEHPLRERLRGQHMLALYRAGRQSDALQTYHDARKSLVDELGIEPILGVGVNHPNAAVGDGPPGPAEVAEQLAKSFDCPPEHARDLAHVAEYIAMTRGVGPLYDSLHALFDRDCAPGAVHRALAELAGVLRARGVSYQLVITTNFDRLLEQAFSDAGEECDVVSYLTLGRYHGKFHHVAPDGAAKLVEIPNTYADLSLERRTVILKIQGGVDRGPGREWESFVVSEDDHIDYLAQADIAVVVPVTLPAKLRRSHLLFLGYPLHEWSLRVLLHRFWGRERVGYQSWAIGAAADAIEQQVWRQRGIDTIDLPLEAYVESLKSRIEAEVRA